MEARTAKMGRAHNPLADRPPQPYPGQPSPVDLTRASGFESAAFIQSRAPLVEPSAQQPDAQQLTRPQGLPQGVPQGVPFEDTKAPFLLSTAPAQSIASAPNASQMHAPMGLQQRDPSCGVQLVRRLEEMRRRQELQQQEIAAMALPIGNVPPALVAMPSYAHYVQVACSSRA